MEFLQIWLKKSQNDFLEYLFILFTLEIQIIHKNIIIFFSKMFFYSIIFIFFFYLQHCHQYRTTMNNQFQALNAPKINIYIFIFLFVTHTISLSFHLLFHPKILNFFNSKFIILLELRRFIILSQERVCNFRLRSCMCL